MLNHVHDHTCSLRSICAPSLQRAHQSYYAEVPALALDEQSRLVDQVIGFAFETLGVRHLDVRVYGSDNGALAAQFDVRSRQRSLSLECKPDR